MTVRQVLDELSAALRGSLAEQPTDRAKLLDTVGRVYLGLGHPADAAPLLAEAIDLRRSLPAATEPELADSLERLAELRYAQADYASAEQLLREGHALRLAAQGHLHPQVAESLNDLAAVADALGAARKPRFSIAVPLRSCASSPGHAVSTMPRPWPTWDCCLIASAASAPPRRNCGKPSRSVANYSTRPTPTSPTTPPIWPPCCWPRSAPKKPRS